MSTWEKWEELNKELNKKKQEEWPKHPPSKKICPTCGEGAICVTNSYPLQECNCENKHTWIHNMVTGIIYLGNLF